VGDRFILLNRGRMTASFERETVVLDELIQAMAGGSELDALTHEINVIRND
jgi:simple sugar transport system ATP-binding protein